MFLSANAARLTMTNNPGAGKVNPGVFEDFQIICGRGRKVGFDPAGYMSTLLKAGLHLSQT